VRHVAHDPASGVVDPGSLQVDQDTACVVAQYPNFFGGLDDLQALADAAHAAGALFVVAADPIALAILTPPGALGADVCVGEAQPLGAPVSLGGPVCGYFAGKKEFVRRFPGRIVGETVDGHGRRGFVLTLQTREQHIRREKATSNICTNQGLIALMNTIYLSLLGKQGLIDVATLCFQKTHHAAALALAQASVPRSTGPFVREVALKLPVPAAQAIRTGARARRAARRRRRGLLGRDEGRAARRRDREAHDQGHPAVGQRAGGGGEMTPETETPSVQSGAAQARPGKDAPPPPGALAGLPPPAAPVLPPVPAGIVEPLLSELSVPGHRGVRLPACDVPETALAQALPAWAIRKEPAALPEMSEPEVIRHFTRLSTLNHHLDKGIYPLGSCTMKHNPKINDELAFLPGMAGAHPLSPAESIQGALEIVHRLEGMLAKITGFDAVTLMPAAGAQGEFTGMLLARAYYASKGETNATKVLVPDSAHGTNPASVHAVGWSVVEIKSKEGHLDLETLKAALGPDVAAVMVTQPSTLGMFEPQIQEAADLIHAAGAQLYLDGANFNALVGLVQPGKMFDLMHLNLHKTFSTPHGGGGPGAGPVAVKAHLEPFLPGPGSAARATRSTSSRRARKASGACTRSSATSGCWCARTATSARSARTGSPRSAARRSSTRTT
jgi:glycine cleavage system protein P-like pyridoxal-binding family